VEVVEGGAFTVVEGGASLIDKSVDDVVEGGASLIDRSVLRASLFNSADDITGGGTSCERGGTSLAAGGTLGNIWRCKAAGSI